MLAAIADTLQVANYGLLAVGAVVLIVHVVGVRRARLRGEAWFAPRWEATTPTPSPQLPEVSPSANAGPDISAARGDFRGRVGFFHVFAALFAFFAVLAGCTSLFVGDATPTDLTPGADKWFRGMAADHVARLAACSFMLLLLGAARDLQWRTSAAMLLRTAGVGVAALLALLPVIDMLVIASVYLFGLLFPGQPPATHVVLEALQHNAWGASGVWWLISGAVVLAPVSEELFFRGVLLRASYEATRNPWIAAGVSGIAFGLVHWSVPYSVLPLVCMGAALAYVRMRYDSLAVCIIVHMLFNARTMAMAVLAPELVESF